jgi:flagellar transcriptional activator FlhD
MNKKDRACERMCMHEGLVKRNKEVHSTTTATQGAQARASGPEITAEIRDVNLAYLLLAQRLLREDRPTAMIRLGVGGELADLLGNLPLSQMVKLAASSFLLCRFRLGDHPVLGALAVHDQKDPALKHAHASILMAGQRPEAARGPLTAVPSAGCLP